jgi:hypothetical protein
VVVVEELKIKKKVKMQVERKDEALPQSLVLKASTHLLMQSRRSVSRPHSGGSPSSSYLAYG